MRSHISSALFALTVSLLSISADANDMVTMSLDEFQKTKLELERLKAEAARGGQKRPVAVGETIYRGRSDGRNLHLDLTLREQLAATKDFKDVEVIGTDAVIVSAKQKGQPIALTARGDRWVWTTRDSGPVEIQVELVVPPRGPRGSIEYRFGVVESPVTELTAFFPTANLSPQVSGAVTNQVRAARGGTELVAVLSPAREIHVVGFHDVDAGEGAREAKLYGETENLLSISDDGVELFSVVSFAILYAPQKRFRIALPKGFELVSADGEGAFQYTIESQGADSILTGETAFGLVQRYEISLRLRRPLAPTDKTVPLPVPRLLDVERDSGFVAIEIPGKISIAGVEGKDFTGIDVRELPEAILRSSVSPVVRAFRYSGERGEATIALARHPEKSLAAGGVDVLRATSVITADGHVMTDLLFTIRNNLQQYLALELAEGAEVRSAVLDGDPIKPSRDAKGRVLVPLRRSKSGPSGLVPFRVQLVYESEIGSLGVLGLRDLALPKLAVPVASVDWSVYVPGTFTTAGLKSPISEQSFIKNAQWHRGIDDGDDSYLDDESGGDNGGIAGEEDYEGEDETEAPAEDGGGEEPAEGNEEDAPAPEPDQHRRAETERGPRGGQAAATDRASGAMPVRVQLPRDGQELRTQRFWIDADETVGAKLYWVKTPLPMIAQAFLVVAMALILAGAFMRSRERPLGRIFAGVVLGAAIAWMWSASAAFAGFAFAVITALIRRGAHRELVDRVRRLGGSFVDALAARAKAKYQELAAEFEARRSKSVVFALFVPTASFAWLAAKLVVLAVLSTVLIVEIFRLIALLQNPL